MPTQGLLPFLCSMQAALHTSIEFAGMTVIEQSSPVGLHSTEDLYSSQSTDILLGGHDGRKRPSVNSEDFSDSVPPIPKK